MLLGSVSIILLIFERIESVFYGKDESATSTAGSGGTFSTF
jgi:hypothetical protein